jgi:NAD(P)-dependent dehydrogenase (short-subunit alcohol dehydrogenase family)
MMTLNSRVALVTAAGSGIGRAGAKIMAREGATVIVTDLDGMRAQATADTIRDSGGTAESFAIDVADDQAIGALMDGIIARHGRLDILHNHAGMQVGGALEALEPEDFDASWKINVRAQMRACQFVLPQMRAQGGGVILNTASNAGVFLGRGMLAYITTKSAVITMTKQIALDYAADNIRVNALCPGWVDTPFNAAYTSQLGGRDALERVIETAVPMRRFGQVEEIAEAILFLVSDRSSFITGHALVIDGGECLAGGVNSTM